MTEVILLHTEITVELTYPSENTIHPSVNARTHTRARTHTHTLIKASIATNSRLSNFAIRRSTHL